MGPRVRPRERPRKPPQEHPRGVIFFVLALQALPTKATHKGANRLCPRKCQGPLNGGVSNGGFPDLDLSFLFCPFFVLLGPRHRQVTDLDVTVLGFSGPGLPFPRQVLCGDATPFSYHFSVHQSCVLGRTELCHEVWTPGPQNPKSSATKTTTWHCSRDFPGDFPICPGTLRGFSRLVLFLFLGLLSLPTRNSPERVRDTIWTIREKSGKRPSLETPRFSFSQIGRDIITNRHT